LKKTVAGEVLTEEDDGEGNLVAQLHEPALWAGSGCRRGTMTRHSFGLVEQLSAARRRRRAKKWPVRSRAARSTAKQRGGEK
jgi:hypothetical protein